MCNPYNTTQICFAISTGDYFTAIALLSRIPFNHKRYAYLYNRIAVSLFRDVQEIGPIADDIYNAFNMLKYPYEYTYANIRKQKGGVIK